MGKFFYFCISIRDGIKTIMNGDIIIKDTLEQLGTEVANRYIAHVYCYAGTCEVGFNDSCFQMEAGDSMIIVSNKLVENIAPSEDFRCKVIHIKDTFLEMCTPEGNNYYVTGTMSLFLNPVMKLMPEEQEQCRADFEEVEHRLYRTSHHFYQEVLMSCVRTLFLDFYDFHARIYGYVDVPVQGAQVLSRFFLMLESGTYRTHREVAYYASELCVVPKYLSELCIKFSGVPANYWIKRFTIQEIKKLLRDKSLTIVQIADMLNFSSPAYLNRYVHKNLGVSPTDYRR